MSSSSYTTPTLLPSPAIKPRGAIDEAVTDGARDPRGKVASRLPDWWSELDDDVYHAVAEHIRSCDLPHLGRTSHRWRKMVDAAWPAICSRRFPALPPPMELPTTVLWYVATRGDEDDAIRAFLVTLGHLQREWPDAISATCDGSGINNRVLDLQARSTSLRLPADAALLYVLGARIEGFSPVGTATGDFGPAYHPETPREPWRMTLAWEPLHDAEDAWEPDAWEHDAWEPLHGSDSGESGDESSATAAAAVMGDEGGGSSAIADDDGAPVQVAASSGSAPRLLELQSLTQLQAFWEVQVRSTVRSRR